MSVLSVIVFVAGTIGVWFTIKQTIWCWPFALTASLASIFEFYEERLFGDMCLQVFYFFAGVYGWIYWKQQQQQVFEIKKMNIRLAPLLIGITAFQAYIYYHLLIYFNGDRPIIDAILTACSLTTTFMMTKKWVENWILWVVIDAAYIVLYGLKEMWPFVALYLLFTIIAFYGWLKWRKEAV